MPKITNGINISKQKSDVKGVTTTGTVGVQHVTK